MLNAELDTHRALTADIDDATGRRHHVRLAAKPTESQMQIYRIFGVSDRPLHTRRYVAESPGSDEKDEAVVPT